MRVATHETSLARSKRSAAHGRADLSDNAVVINAWVAAGRAPRLDIRKILVSDLLTAPNTTHSVRGASSPRLPQRQPVPRLLNVVLRS